jgi:DNA mismatch repair protein MutL
MYNSLMPIEILPDEVVSQIAAGEVVERPASVIKELVENSLDAGAHAIDVQTAGAGKKLLEVRDDGRGIPQDELKIAVTRHATSKLHVAADLFSIHTLGFRGEALASIGSVSQMTLISRAYDAEIGAKVIVDGGRLERVEQAGVPTGTTVRVENLFFNVPARLKFMKSDLTERRQIDEVVTRYALAYPEVRFTLNQEGKTALHTTGSGDRREILAAMIGVDQSRQMLEVLADQDDIKISGLISPVSFTRSNRKGIQFFVNGRPVQDAVLTVALLQGYHTMLMVGRYPFAQIFMELPPSQVDVNVHPTKAEVRFQDRDRIFSAVQRSIRQALLAYTPVPELRSQYQWDLPGQETSAKWGGNPIWGNSTPEMEAPVGSRDGEPSAELGAETPRLPHTSVPLLRLIGQVASAYLIAEGPDGLYLIDQHAAHERVLFEKLMAQLPENIPSQRLLETATVELTPASSRLLATQLDTLGKLGFKVEEFGRNTYLVRAVPAILAGMNPEAALRVLVEDFEEDETPLKDEVEAKIIARVCKRAAVKAGHVLSHDEQQALLHDLEHTQSPRTCPHGRPTMIHISVDLLERQFGRRGAR